MSEQVYVGVLEDFFETGSEGTWWCIVRDLEPGEKDEPYARLVMLQKGDEFTVFNGDGSERFTCIIEPDYQIGYEPYPNNPSLGQPIALGRWIHWTQKGWQPDDWASLFMPEIPQEEFASRLIQRAEEAGLKDLFDRYEHLTRWSWSEEYQKYAQFRAGVLDEFRLRGRIRRNVTH